MAFDKNSINQGLWYLTNTLYIMIIDFTNDWYLINTLMNTGINKDWYLINTLMNTGLNKDPGI